MDEAEYCDRISIMVDGVIRALDTPGELKRSSMPLQWTMYSNNWLAKPCEPPTENP